MTSYILTTSRFLQAFYGPSGYVDLTISQPPNNYYLSLVTAMVYHSLPD